MDIEISPLAGGSSMPKTLDEVVGAINQTYETMKDKHLDEVTDAYSGYQNAYAKEQLDPKEFNKIKKLTECDEAVKNGILALMEAMSEFAEWNIHTNGIVFNEYMMSLRAAQAESGDSYQGLLSEPELGSDMIIPINNAMITKQHFSLEAAKDLQIKLEIIVDTYNKFMQLDMMKDQDVAEAATYQIRCLEGMAQGLAFYRQSQGASIASVDQEEQENIRLNQIALMCIDDVELANKHIKGFKEHSLDSSIHFLENEVENMLKQVTGTIQTYQRQESQNALNKSSGSLVSRGIMLFSKPTATIKSVTSTGVDNVKSLLIDLKSYANEKPKPVKEDASFDEKLAYYIKLSKYKTTLEEKMELASIAVEKNEGPKRKNA